MYVKLASFFLRGLQRRHRKNNNNLPKKTNQILILGIHPFITSETISTILNAIYTNAKKKTIQNQPECLASNSLSPFVVALPPLFHNSHHSLPFKSKTQTSY
jgi:hypothetical protein